MLYVLKDCGLVKIDAQQAWAQRVAQIFVRYAPTFCAALSSNTPVTLVNGWAGAASYGAGRWRVAGAPVIVAEYAARFANEHGRVVRCLNLDPDLANVAALQRALQPWADAAQTLLGGWAERTNDVLKTVGASAALVLLDGESLTPIAGNLEHWARRLAKTEILVRYDRAAVAALLAARSESTQTLSVERQLDQLFGTRSWRTIVAGASGDDERDLQLRDLYSQMLTQLRGGRFKWAAACPIRTSWGALDYDLVFAAAERSAGAAMNAVLYAVEGQRDENPHTALLARGAGKPQQTSLFEAAPPSAVELRAATIAAIVADLRIVCLTEPRLWSYADLFDQLLRGGWFGHITADHGREACLQLQRSGQLERVSQGHAWDEKTLVRLRG